MRGKQGIERLNQFFNNAEKAQIPYKQHTQHFHEMQGIIKEIGDVNAEIDKLGMSHFFSDHKLRIRNSLKAQLETLFFQLEQFTEEGSESKGKTDGNTAI